MDSIYTRVLEDNGIYSPFELIVYRMHTDSVIQSTNHSVMRYGQRTRRKELDLNMEIQAMYKSHIALILQKMLLFIILSAMVTGLIIMMLSYQLRIITRQKRIEKVRQDFIDSMTHELRHPLQGALSMAEILENPTFAENPERVSNAISRIKHNLFNLSKLLDSIVQKSYSEKLQQGAEWQEGNLQEMLNDLIASFMLLSDKEIKFTTHFEHMKSGYCYDPVHFPNAVKNLIDNAVKYSSETVEITISVVSNENEFSVIVSDNGIGIPKEEIPRIFDKFYKVHNPRIKHGFGLGLSYVKWVAEIHLGSVNVQSRYGKGSEFIITTPILIEKA
ncbi:sensor histidine kinase [Williamwhitmania taraxaci]|uniref:sensor histidine kinase n=1 Tax=Williamwhitmania taraxaci TaxID=1640674 RepID=UPI000F7A7DAF|nr:HAMP domain-containing sensor histidine kinase [Williamwhitmania taraxaci]